MYPAGFETNVDPGATAEPLEGAGRPGHFRGVCTVVCKLFNAVRPDVAVFGQKDYQQLAVVRRMTADLDLGVEVIGVPTVRESDGLARSSRNRRLEADQRDAADCIFRGLDAARAAFADGERNAARLAEVAAAPIEAEPLARLEYLAVNDAALAGPGRRRHRPRGDEHRGVVRRGPADRQRRPRGTRRHAVVCGRGRPVELAVACARRRRARACRRWTPTDTADVVIVGAGFTGLWTAYYLAERRPEWRIVVLEAEVVGFGASGRNGGWCSALLPMSLSSIATDHGRDGRPARPAGDGRHGRRGGPGGRRRVDRLRLRQGRLAARGPQRGRRPTRVRRDVRDHHAFGFGDDDVRWLDADEARERVGMSRRPRRVVHPRTAPRSTRPASSRGLAAAVERRGVVIHEHTPVEHIERRCVRANGHRGAHAVLRAGHRGVHRRAPRPAPRARADLLADDRHRAAPGRRPRRRSGWPTGRRSATPAGW